MFTVAYVVRAVSPGHYVLPQAIVEDMYRPDRFGRTATGRSSSRRGKMKHWRFILASLAGAAFLVALAGSAWVYSLGGPPLGKDLETSHVVLDREGKLLRAYATSEGRWRLPATDKDVDPRASSSCCSPTRTSASTSMTASIYWRSAARLFSWQNEDISSRAHPL